jgi:hypothetical protein
MAKTPGTNVMGGVRGTMSPPFNKGMSTTGVGGGMNGQNHAPFNKPQAMGGGSIPTKFYDGMSAKAATTVNAGMSKPTASTNPPVGTRRFKSPK